MSTDLDTGDLSGLFADESSPETVDEQAPEYGENNRDLPEELRAGLDHLVNMFQEREQLDRINEVLSDRMMRFYDDGIQHIYCDWAKGVYQIGTGGAFISIGNGQSIQCPEFMDSYNIFRSRRRSIDAVLTQNPPGDAFVADKPDASEDIEAAETANGYRRYFDQQNVWKDIQQKIARMLELSGRTVAWVYTKKSRSMYGLNDQGEPRSMETVGIYGTLESKLPIACSCFEKALYTILYDDKEALLLKGENEWIREDISAGESGLGESEWERFCRLGIKQAKKSTYMTGLSINYLTTEMNVFLRPAVFEDSYFDAPFLAGGIGEDGKHMTRRDKMRELYPEGAHVKYIGKTYSESWNESPDDVLTVGFPNEGDGMTRIPLMWPMRVVQDAFNDYMNAKRENYEKGWSATFFRGSADDYDTFTDQRSSPNNYILLKEADPGTPIEESFYREPQVEPPSGFDEAIEELRGVISQDISGALPALQGASRPDQTASGQAMDRSQAMGILGPSWSTIQQMSGSIHKQAALLASSNPDHAKEIAVIGQNGKTVSIKMERLSKGKFHYHVSDSSFPETTAAQRANLQAVLPMLAKTPVGAEIFMSPDNVEHFLEVFGDQDIVLTPALAFKKQVREIEILLDEPPNPPDPNAMAQYQVQKQQYDMQHATMALAARQSMMPEPPYQPPPPPMPTPSIMPEADDYHQWESAKCQEYLSSEDCWLRQTIGPPDVVERNKMGVMNVRLHKGVHDQFMAQQQAAAAAAQQQMKPPAESINFKDLPPQGQVQEAKQAGITIAAPEAQSGVNAKAAAPGGPGTGTV